MIIHDKCVKYKEEKTTTTISQLSWLSGCYTVTLRCFMGEKHDWWNMALVVQIALGSVSYLYQPLLSKTCCNIYTVKVQHCRKRFCGIAPKIKNTQIKWVTQINTQLTLRFFSNDFEPGSLICVLIWENTYIKVLDDPCSKQLGTWPKLACWHFRVHTHKIIVSSPSEACELPKTCCMSQQVLLLGNKNQRAWKQTALPVSECDSLPDVSHQYQWIG